MQDLFLKLMGVPAEQVSRITRGRLDFRGDINPAWIILLATLLGVMVFLMYRKAAPELSPVKKYVLATLRTVFLVLILLLLLRPVLRFDFEGSVRRELVMLLDTSTSMKIEDPRSDAEDLKRVALIKGPLDPLKGLKQDLATSASVEKIARLDLYRTALKSERLNLLPRLARDYNVDTFTFDGVVAEVAAASMRQAPREGDADKDQPPINTAWLDKIEAKGQTT